MDFNDMVNVQTPTHEPPQRMAIFLERQDAQLVTEALMLLRCQIQADRHYKLGELTDEQMFRLGEKMGAIDRIKFHIDSSMGFASKFSPSDSE